MDSKDLEEGPLSDNSQDEQKGTICHDSLTPARFLIIN